MNIVRFVIIQLINMSFLCNWICCQASPQLERSTVKIPIDEPSIKIRNSHYQQITERCKKSYEFYVDKEFPPQNSSLGEFQNVGRKIGWKRIGDIVPDCCLFDPRRSMSSSIIASATSDSYITASLISLAFDPQKIYEIFRRATEISVQGVYQILVKKNGNIQCITIDDYVPVFQDTGRPLLCGSINRQIWVMLIYKAWAKICGSYSAIKEADCLDFLNTFSVAPCISYLLHPSIADDKELFSQIKSILQKKEYSLCAITSSNAKKNLISDYHYAVCGLSGERAVQMVSGSGGKQTYLRITVQQLLQNCVELIVSKPQPKMINGESNKYKILYNKPFFVRMSLTDDFSLVLLINRQKSNERNTFFRAILGKQQKDRNYIYVDSKLQAYYNNLVLTGNKLTKGNYSIMLLINGQANKKVEITISCYHKLEGQIASPYFVQQMKQNENYIIFIKTILADYAKSSQKCIKKQLKNSKSVLHIQQQYRRGGFGYLFVKPSNSLKHLRAHLNFKQIQASQYELFNRITQNTLVLQPGLQTIFVFFLRERKDIQSTSNFPPGISLVEIF